MGFASLKSPAFASGYVSGDKLYLAVWNLGGKSPLAVKLDGDIVSCKVGYPASLKTEYSIDGNTLTVNFDEEYMARFFEITLDKSGK